MCFVSSGGKWYRELILGHDVTPTTLPLGFHINTMSTAAIMLEHEIRTTAAAEWYEEAFAMSNSSVVALERENGFSEIGILPANQLENGFCHYHVVVRREHGTEPCFRNRRQSGSMPSRQEFGSIFPWASGRQGIRIGRRKNGRFDIVVMNVDIYHWCFLRVKLVVRGMCC